MADALVYQYRSDEPTLDLESRPAYQMVGQYRSLQDTFTGMANLDWLQYTEKAIRQYNTFLKVYFIVLDTK